MQLEAVTVCIDYSDLLELVAPHNRPLLERWLVITAHDDKRTRDVCRRFSIDCITSDDYTRAGDFGKGRLIDRALASIEAEGWMLHLDADIALPKDLHQVLDDAHLHELTLYGCDRLNVVGLDAWRRVEARGLWCRQNTWGVDLARPDTTLGMRVANHGHGYTPIGFFQLWHAAAYHHRGQPARRYPKQHGTAARTDVKHALQWDRQERALIPELLVWHLETEKAPMGANWNGRTTALVGDQKPDCY